MAAVTMNTLTCGGTTDGPTSASVGEHHHPWRSELRRGTRLLWRLGWSQAFDSGDFAVFELRGALLALFPIDKLGSDAHAQPEPGRGGIRLSIIISVDAPEDVDELAARVRQAGGKLTKDPVDAEFFVGRHAYFADPEGNFWEIACAPPDNPVVSASRRAAGVALRPRRLKPRRKAGQKGKKKTK